MLPSFDFSSNKQKVKSKFEEDIIRPFASNFSLSATFQTKNKPDIKSFGDLVLIFPGLGPLKIDSNEELIKVNYFEVIELSCQLGKIRFGKQRLTDEISLEFWYSLNKQLRERPHVVEFTFKCSATERADKSSSTLLEKFPISLVKNANALYYSLQDIEEFFRPVGAKTKTQFAYEFDNQG